MADKSGYILIDRNILDWKWWKNHETLILFLTLLLKANYKDVEFENQIIHRGQLVTSLPSLCQQADLTIQQVRTSLNRLISTGEITNKSTNRYRIITIVNYDKYQELTGKPTVKQQTTNRQLTDKQQQVNTINTINTRKAYKRGRSAPPDSPSGGKEPGREEGTYEDIPVKDRDGTYHSFKTYQEYWDWRNQ